MSTHQVSKPRLANHSITELSDRPGTCRSKVGCEAIDEPCTNSIVPALALGSAGLFCQRNRRISPLRVQCSRPAIAPSAVVSLLICLLPVYRGWASVLAPAPGPTSSRHLPAP